MKKCVNSVVRGAFYCVLDGETLGDIEAKFITTKNLIIKDNKLTSEVRGGDMLYIKSYERRYLVGVEDTPETIASKLGVPFSEIVKINKITYIYPFMVIVI